MYIKAVPRGSFLKVHDLELRVSVFSSCSYLAS